MTAPVTSPEAQAFLASVEQELLDLPAEERRELLDDLALHLAEREGDLDSAPLGSPADYARELRDAAGLPARTTGRRRRLATGIERVVGSTALRELRAFVPQLRPAWWVLRGYLLVAVIALQDVNGTRDFPVPALAGSHVLGVAGVLAAATASVAVGRRRLPRAGVALVLAANLGLLVVAGDLMADARWRLVRYQGMSVGGVVDPLATTPLASRHGPVTNVFVYTPDGKPVEGVLLYDQDGRPLQVGEQLWWPDRCKRVPALRKAVDGVPVPNVFPQAYVLDPSGETLSGLPVAAGQCQAVVARPTITVPKLAPVSR